MGKASYIIVVNERDLLKYEKVYEIRGQTQGQDRFKGFVQ